MIRRVEKEVALNRNDQEAESISMDYLKGYRDGLKDRDRTIHTRRSSGDGILGALLAIVLLGGIGYVGWNYATTGQIIPSNLELHLPSLKSSAK